LVASNNERGIKVDITKKAGESYYFSHEIIKKYENGSVRFIDSSGAVLKPSYFGAGLEGMNGTLNLAPQQENRT
jgi:hypothetical protein